MNIMKIHLTIFILITSDIVVKAQDSLTLKSFYPVNSSNILEEKYKKIADSLLTKEIIRNAKFTSDYIEMLYYLRNFRDQAKRNANQNWDKGYRYSANWIKWVLTEKTNIFPEAIKKEIKNDIKRYKKYRRPYTDDDLYDRLLRRIIEYYLSGEGEVYKS
jgi:hypothetical protein